MKQEIVDMQPLKLSPASDFQAYDLLLSCVIITDNKGEIKWVNAAMQTLFERSSRSFEGGLAKFLFKDREGFQKAFDAVITQRVVSVTYVGSIAKADTQVVSANMHMLQDVDDSVMLELHQIEQQTLSERSKRLAREVEIYQEIFHNLAHEVKNPLGGLRGAAQLLEMELDKPEHHEYTQVIISEADRLQALVDRLIRPAESGLERSEFNIHEVCERVYALLRAEYHDRLKVIRDYDASLPEIIGDKAKIVQAYLNLSRNAAQAILGAGPNPDGTVILKTRVLSRQFLVNRVYRLVLVLSVIDNGPGVPEHIADRVFHPLVTGRADGTGLGLSLAQELVRQHGGLIEYESRPGHTEFKILLPMGEA